jgi:hypothetical protein
LQVNVSAVDDFVELDLTVSPSEHVERDFELFCAHDFMSHSEVLATRLHLQFQSCE